MKLYSLAKYYCTLNSKDAFIKKILFVFQADGITGINCRHKIIIIRGNTTLPVVVSDTSNSVSSVSKFFRIF